MTRLLFAACAAALSLAACNQAGPPSADKSGDTPSGERRGFRQDANGDGKMTLDEAKAS